MYGDAGPLHDAPTTRRGCRDRRWLRRRDPVLLDRLIEEYQHRLLRYLVALTADRPLAEDLIASEVSYCARCGFKVAPTCPRCGRSLAAGQAYCAHCGEALADKGVGVGAA